MSNPGMLAQTPPALAPFLPPQPSPAAPPVQAPPQPAPAPQVPKAPQVPGDKMKLMGEAYKRGLLPADKKALYEEAQKRGLVPGADASGEPLSVAGLEGDVSNVSGEASAYIRAERGMAPDIDYDTGASPLAKAWVSRSDNPKETQLALEHFYGPLNVGQDAGGRWWVREGDKKVEVYGGGQGVGTEMKKFGYGTLAYAPIFGGAVTGAALAGGAAPEFTPISQMLGAGVGAVGGKAIDELAKALQGVYAKTPYEELQKLGHEAAWNMAFEALPPATKAILSPIKNGLKSFFGITPAGESMTRSLAKGGAQPPLKTAVPGATGLQWHQAFRDKVMGDPKAEPNTAYMRAQLHNVLEDSGYPKDQIDSMMEELTKKDASLTTLPEGQAITGKIGAHIERLSGEANAAIATAKTAVDDEIKALKSLGAQSSGALGKDVAGTIVQSRRRFSEAMTRAYDQVTEATGGRSIVRTADIKAAAEEILEMLPETAHPPILQKIMDMPLAITLKDAHAYRSQLRQAAWSGNLTPGLTEHNLNDAARAFDGAITEAGADMAARGETNVATALRSVDRAYGEGIAKFRDTMFNQIVRRARSGIFPDASTVASQFIRPGETERLTTLWGMAGPELRGRIRSADMANIQKEAKGEGLGLLTALQKRGEQLDIVYGKADADKLRTAAKELAALDGKLPENMTLEPGVAQKLLARQIGLIKELDAFVAENPIAALGVPKAADRAVRFVTTPGRENTTRSTMQFFGAGSQEWKAVQTFALKDVLSRAMVQAPDLQPRVLGSAMKSVLGKYTRGQLDMLFPHGLEDDLRLLADKAEFLFPPGEHDMSAGLAAGAVKAGLPFTAPAYLYAKFWGWVADHPVWFHNLASVARAGDVSELVAIRKVLVRAAIRSTGQTGSGSGKPPPDTIIEFSQLPQQ